MRERGRPVRRLAHGRGRCLRGAGRARSGRAADHRTTSARLADGKARLHRCCAGPTAASSTTASSTSARDDEFFVDRQRVEHRQGPRVDPRARSAPARRRRRLRRRPALIAVQGPKAVALVDALAGGDARRHADASRSRVHESPGVPCTGRAHRLHRRGRLRAGLPRPSDAARAVERAARGRRRRRRPADRARRARHAAARGPAAALRQRHRRRPPPRSRPGSAGRSSSTSRRLHRPRRRCARRSRAASTRQLVGFRIADGRARSRATATRSSTAAREGDRHGVSPAAAPASPSAARSAWATSRSTRARRAPSSRSTAAARTSPAPWSPASSTSEDRTHERRAIPDDLRYTKEHEWLRDPGHDLARSASPSSPSISSATSRCVDLPKEGDLGHQGPAVRHGRERQGGLRPVRAGLRQVVKVNDAARRQRPSW